MSRLLRLAVFFGLCSAGRAFSADAPIVAPSANSPAASIAANSSGEVPSALLMNFVNWLHRFFPKTSDTLFHVIACLLIVVAAILLRRVFTYLIFVQLKKLAAKTTTTLDDKLFPALEQPVATLIMVIGIFAALTVLKSSQYDHYLGYDAQISIDAVILWGLFRAGGAFMDHLEEVAHANGIGIAAFMPLIKKTLAVVFIIFGVLMIAQNVGADVKAFLAGLGIGGLALALAAQDTISNLFGSFVVVMDHPFRVGDVVKIGSHEGKVEDIGLRSTRLRTGSRSQIVIPNKTVAADAVENYSRMPQRRVDQTIGLTYDSTPEQLRAILEDIRNLLHTDPEVHQEVVVAHFVGYGESSLDLQIVYFAADANWARHLALRERINFKIMDAVKTRGLFFAFPTRAIQFEGSLAKQLAAAKLPAS